MEYYDTVARWLKAGRPLDEPFLIVREYIMDTGTGNVSEDIISYILGFLCILITRCLTYHSDATGGSSYRIEPVPPVFHNVWSFGYAGETFTVCTEPSIYPGPSKVRLSVGAIATILSDKEET